MHTTPNDTLAKQLLTALSMTLLFALGVLTSFGLFYLSDWLSKSSLEWVSGLCSGAVSVGAWVNTVIVVVMAFLSMLDWMRSTVKRHNTKSPHGHNPLHSH
jgi:hypothetical protein